MISYQYVIVTLSLLFSFNTTFASPARKLRTALQESTRRGVLFGHHDDTLYGHNWTNKEYGPSDVYNITGSYPALLSFDLAGIELGKINYNSIDKVQLIKEVASHNERGGYVMFSWHTTNPSTLGTAWDVSDKNVVKNILKGGTYHHRYCSYLDSLVLFFKSLKDDKGKPIGVLFRPFHEFQGSHFWWTKDNCTDKQFISLWRYTIKYLRKKGLNNLLFVFSPSTDFHTEKEYCFRYPGDKYIDVLACELYHYQIPQSLSLFETRVEFISRMQRYLSILAGLSKKKEKLYAISETGIRKGLDSLWWTKAVLPSLHGYSPCFINVWRNGFHNERETYCAYKGDASEKDFKEFSMNKNIIFIN